MRDAATLHNAEARKAEFTNCEGTAIGVILFNG
jgi:hypothetical protein